MRSLLIRKTMLALAVFGSAMGCGGFAAVGQAAPPPGGQPTPPTDVQPVPGAMPGSETVPDALSPQNAADDKLPIAAYAFKTLTGAQRRAIYQAVTGKSLAAAPANAADATEVGTQLPLSVKLTAMPDSVAALVPQTAGYDYAMVGDTLLIVAPVNRVVSGVIAE